MPAIWTDTDGKVQRTYHDESQLTDEELSDAIIVDSIPDDTGGTGQIPSLYYTDTEGLHYQYTDELAKLPDSLSQEDKEALYLAITNMDYDEAASILSRLL